MLLQSRCAALTLTAALSALFLPSLASAGEGHDHGETPAVASGPALPRFAATSDTFELVGVVNGQQLTLYLDRAADNSPVKDAKLELELGGVKIDAKPHADGEFEATLAQALKPGVIPVTATVMAGNETDLLAGELDLHETGQDEITHVHGWQEYVAWGTGAVVALALLAFVIRRITVNRTTRHGGLV